MRTNLRSRPSHRTGMLAHPRKPGSFFSHHHPEHPSHYDHRPRRQQSTKPVTTSTMTSQLRVSRRSQPQISVRGAATVTGVNNVTMDQGMSMMSRVIQQTNLQNRKVNTALAYDPKSDEWYSFCDYHSGHMPEALRYTVNSTRLFAFLTYQAFREQRKRGGKKKNDESRNALFDPQEYQRIIATYGALDLNNSDVSIPDPANPIGADAMNTYKSTVRKIWETQVAHGANSTAWELIYDGNAKALVGMVKNRKARIRKANFAEKIDGEFSPFTTIDQVGNIEEWFWGNGKTNSRSALSGLRNRFAFLSCYKGVLRSETLFLGELSDLLHLYVLRGSDEDPLSIGIMQMDQGKTVNSGGSRQYGRFLRSKDVEDCPMGALGFYLFHRFNLSGEMGDAKRPDFRKNKDWFRMKLMADASGEIKTLCATTYTKPIRKCFSELRIIAAHFGHWGRASGPVKLELEELENELIRILGNWDAKVQETRYSSRIPVKALRVMAGWKAKEKHLNPRTRVMPSTELQECIWPWIDEELEKVWAIRDDPAAASNEGVTAASFLVFLKQLRIVILQDAAAMLTVAPDRSDHVIFRSAVFVNQGFLQFKEEMKRGLGREVEEERATAETVLPGLHRRFDTLEVRQIAIINDQRDVKRQLSYQGVQMNSIVEKWTEVGTVLARPPAAPTQQQQQQQQQIESPGDPNLVEGEGFELAAAYHLLESYETIRDLHSCWFGKGRFEGMPIDGGIAACEKKWKAKWRKGWDGAESKRFSRIKRLIDSIDGDEERLKMVDRQYFKKRSLASCIEFCQQEAWIQAKSRKTSTGVSPRG